jgi:hypothetical protein
MTDHTATDEPQLRPAVGAQVDERVVRPLLRLTARTRKADNRLREACANMPAWDGRWVVQQEQARVTFAPGTSGPWLFVAPVGVDSRSKDRHSRWVHEFVDADFIVSAS